MAGGPICFISYSRRDYDLRGKYFDRFFSDLEVRLIETISPGQGVTVVFLDTWGVEGGDQWDERICENVATADTFVPILSPQYLDPGPVDCFCGKEFQAFEE